MNELKVAVIFYSMTGTNYRMARWATFMGHRSVSTTKVRWSRISRMQSNTRCNGPWISPKDKRIMKAGVCDEDQRRCLFIYFGI